MSIILDSSTEKTLKNNEEALVLREIFNIIEAKKENKEDKNDKIIDIEIKKEEKINNINENKDIKDINKMAFVFKSEKGTNKLKNTTRDIGPGEYLPQTDIKLIKLNKEPFLSSVKRDIIHANDVPGPGAYYQDETLIN